jgi:uncharacterized protein (TIGR00730 family)
MRMAIASICVFCGASGGVDRKFLDEAYEIGRRIAREGYQLVYGAGASGLMGATANGALAEGGKVIGFYPNTLSGLEKEHTGISELHHVTGMHTRKMGMFERSDAFLILPGGFGTMDETFEVITWKQLHTHRKPVILYNFDGFWHLWREMTDMFIRNGFASEATRRCYDIADTADDVFARLASYGE